MPLQSGGVYVRPVAIGALPDRYGSRQEDEVENVPIGTLARDSTEEKEDQ